MFLRFPKRLKKVVECMIITFLSLNSNIFKKKIKSRESLLLYVRKEDIKRRREKGFTASDFCNGPVSENCKPPEPPKDFPETEEELQEICKAIEFLECKYEYDQICYPHYTEDLKYTEKILEIAREICSEDTLLHAAIVDNLKCFKKLIGDETARCAIGTESTEQLQRYAEILSEEGLVTLTDNENDTIQLYDCIVIMNFAACEALVLDRRCGPVAMNAYVEIIQKAAPLSETCSDAFHLLPTLIRLRTLEEEKENSIAEMFRKKK